MTTIARRIRAVPVRTPTDTWDFIVGLLAASDDTMRDDLRQIGNVASMLISEEHAAADPIIVSGWGPQVRIYTLHGAAAIDGSNSSEQPLLITASPGWRISLPAAGADRALAEVAVEGIEWADIYDPTDDRSAAAAPSVGTVPPDLVVDLTALER
jgi:hypothetical protein